jgi:uncharacterized protein
MQNNASIKSFILEHLKQLPANLYYHNIDHTLYVTQQCSEIGRHCNCTKQELDLLEVAALFHDIGFLYTYENHETASCNFAIEHLPNFGFSNASIKTICQTIMATKIPQSPTNKLGQILADADLEYLGNNQVVAVAHKLYKELQFIHPQLSVAQWNDIQINFLQQHQYFTNYCKLHKAPNKLAYLNLLINSKPK